MAAQHIQKLAGSGRHSRDQRPLVAGLLRRVERPAEVVQRCEQVLYQRFAGIFLLGLSRLEQPLARVLVIGQPELVVVQVALHRLQLRLDELTLKFGRLDLALPVPFVVLPAVLNQHDHPVNERMKVRVKNRDLVK